jgi:hydroxymethylpyrimidine/phosphomethylpyrimidine kinase
VALSIAGSDSGGGAGIQADMRTFAALGVFGTTAITCVTAQNTMGVKAVQVLAASLVREQVEAVVEDMAVTGAKTGLLATAEMVELVACLVGERLLPPLVVDPVFVATSGQSLAKTGAVRAYREHLFPVAAVVTPNLQEAGVLCNEEVTTLKAAREAARRLGELASVVVVKGGHLADTSASVDVIWDGAACWEIAQPRVPTANTHGSGCTFSAAIAAGLASGLPVEESIRRANAFVHRAIEGGATWSLGKGAGPLDHFGWAEKGE